jgi:Pyridoxamine 5'-phosphate oxidase
VATDIGAELPPILLARLGPRRSGVEDIAVPVCTVDDNGFPHPAMLSYAELEADDASAIHAAVGASSRTARYLRANGRMTLLFVDAEVTYYVKTRIAAAETPHPTLPGVACFPLSIEAVLADRTAPGERAARITSGIRFARGTSG